MRRCDLRKPYGKNCLNQRETLFQKFLKNVLVVSISGLSSVCVPQIQSPYATAQVASLKDDLPSARLIEPIREGSLSDTLAMSSIE